MRVAVAHHSLNIPGGAERLCLILIKALKKERHHVTLVSVEKTRWDFVSRNFGDVVKPDDESYLTSLRFSKHLSNMSIALVYFVAYVLQLLLSKHRRRFDLLINTFGDVINSLADITYIHFPLRAATLFSQIPAFTNELRWRAISPIYKAGLSLLDRVSMGSLLTNSKFMRNIIAKSLNHKSLVVYPPVDVRTFSSCCSKKPKTKDLVITISAYTPKRRLELVPRIAAGVKTAKFVIVGKADEYSMPLLSKLRQQSKRLKVEGRVKLLTNVPFTRLLKILTEAKIYLHVMPYDHFGMSVVEAMASGCVPVVHRSGGPWIDILSCSQGEYGFSYTSTEEAANLIEKLLSDEKSRSMIADRAMKRSENFDESIFIRNIARVVEAYVH